MKILSTLSDDGVQSGQDLVEEVGSVTFQVYYKDVIYKFVFTVHVGHRVNEAFRQFFNAENAGLVMFMRNNDSMQTDCDMCNF